MEVGSSSAFSAVAAFSTAGCAAKTDEGIADEINLVPNPANNLVIINYNSTQTQQLTIWVTDMMGKTVLQQTVTASEGDNEISLIIEQLQTGYYIVQLNNGTTKMRTKLLVVK
ncbi:MAG: T9SS type A sorting domain-containing protein [Sphingobacteriales bacterium]|nr:T9SS type A sorting domain-containing protein [Sphingobacteriales bacterium]